MARRWLVLASLNAQKLPACLPYGSTIFRNWPSQPIGPAGARSYYLTANEPQFQRQLAVQIERDRLFHRFLRSKPHAREQRRQLHQYTSPLPSTRAAGDRILGCCISHLLYHSLCRKAGWEETQYLVLRQHLPQRPSRIRGPHQPTPLQRGHQSLGDLNNECALERCAD